MKDPLLTLQVPVVQEAFMPSAAKVEWATELVHAFSQHQAEGRGAFQFRGQMIDRPLLLQALNIIQLVESVGGLGKENDRAMNSS